MKEVPLWNPRWGGGALIFSYIRRLRSFLGGSKILNFNILGVFRGYEDFVDILGGHHKIGLYLVVISMHFRVFS